MKIGVDVDGLVFGANFYNPSLRIPQFLFLLLIPPMLFIQPNRKVVEKLRELSEHNEIISISARPSWVTCLTKLLFKFHKIPFSKIFCIGFGKGTKERKLAVAKREGVEWMVDNDVRLVDYFNSNHIRASRDLK